MKDKLQNAVSYIYKSKEIQDNSANLLDKAMQANDLKIAFKYLRELRIRWSHELNWYLKAEAEIQPKL